MKDYSAILTNVPQTRPLPGRTDMVKNNAGGYSFKITPQEQLERFLLIGTENGTYYTNEQKLTIDNATTIINFIKNDGPKVVETIRDFAVNNRAPKMDAILFTLALAATYGDQSTKNMVYFNLNSVVRTATHLFMFLSNIHNLRGWSRGLRKAVAKFYTSKSDDKLAYQLVKYRNRAGFTHRDVIRLAHVKPTSESQSKLLGYAVGKIVSEETANDTIKAFELAQSLKGHDLANLINKSKLSWEMVPTDQLNDPNVLSALVEHMPIVALIRNLNRFSKAGLTKYNSEVAKVIQSKLRNLDAIKNSGIHPLTVINSMTTYASGKGVLGSSTWDVNQDIVDALHDTYTLSLTNIIPTNKNILIGVDISGSMKTPVNGMQLTASQISNVLAVTMLKTERNADLIWFDTSVSMPKVGRRSSMDEVIRLSPNGGGTDCSLPLSYALTSTKKYDAILILTDNETWAGNRHGLTYIENYRNKVNENIKVIEVAMVSNPYSNIPTNDKNLLRIVGFDASAITVINKFLE